MNAPKRQCPHCQATRASECRAPDTCVLCNCIACSERRRLADADDAAQRAMYGGGPTIYAQLQRALDQLPKSPQLWAFNTRAYNSAVRRAMASDDAWHAEVRHQRFERIKDPYTLPPLPRITCE